MDAQDEEERARDGIVGEGPSSLKDDELRINNNDNKTEEDVKEQSEWAPHSQHVVQVPPQQPQGSVFHWESFLHVRSIKVLLVENDDSTRHVVTALLCNSNYEVIVAPNGLQAWKILEDLRNHIDIVLTEVAMPCLSGIGLLCKIMSHPIRKNIPVIMMSSHDSMGLVFKCLSKGAVDFLLKPIRKNELKILWQHIWRRCHSSSGSGSENDSETQISVKSKTSIKSDNNNGSNDRDYYGSTDLKVDDESDNGSDGQSSWTKEAVKVDRPQAASPCLQIADGPESTCAQVICSNAIISDYVAKGKELVMSTEENPIPILHSTLDSKSTDERPENASGEYSPKKHKVVLNNKVDPQMDSEIEGLREPVNILEENNKAIDDPKELPVVELRGVEDTQETVQSDHNVSRHFVLSALSRYNRTSNAIQVSDEITGSSSLLLKNLEFVKKQSVCKVRNNEDTGSTTNELSVNPLVLKNKSESTLKINGLHPSSALLSKCPPQQLILVKAENIASNVMVAPPSGSHQELPVQHIHHHHHLHHFHNIETHEPLPNQNDFSLMKLTADTHCGSSNFTSLPIGFNPGDYLSYRSASGSNNLNGSKTAVNGGAVNVESDVGLVGKIASVNASGSGSGKRIDENKSSEREAALTKFCQKRKARCFRKKGRYQNRKRVREQRPGLRGQFVKQMGTTVQTVLVVTNSALFSKIAKRFLYSRDLSSGLGEVACRFIL